MDTKPKHELTIKLSTNSTLGENTKPNKDLQPDQSLERHMQKSETQTKTRWQ